MFFGSNTEIIPFVSASYIQTLFLKMFQYTCYKHLDKT